MGAVTAFIRGSQGKQSVRLAPKRMKIFGMKTNLNDEFQKFECKQKKRKIGTEKSRYGDRVGDHELH